jgi:hypothetical protein
MASVPKKVLSPGEGTSRKFLGKFLSLLKKRPFEVCSKGWLALPHPF